jgi:hypothetical protein
MPQNEDFPPIDLTSMPWSQAGSWLNFSRPQMASMQPLGPGLYLRSNHCRGQVQRELVTLQLLTATGKRVEPIEEAQFDRMLLGVPSKKSAKKPSSSARSAPTARPEGQVEVIFDQDGNVGLRGTGGIGLHIRAAIPEVGIVRHSAAHVVAYRESDDRVVLNVRTALRRYGFHCQQGSMTMEAPFDIERTTRADITIVPDSTGEWTCWIDEFWSTWQPKKRSFAREQAGASQRWQTFQEQFITPRGKHGPASVLAQWLLWSSTVPATGFFKRPAILMSRNWMDQVWSWDNCFNATSLATAHPKVAFDQFMVVADHQDEHGAYPDGVNDGFKHYNFSKPPVQGILTDWIESHHPNFLTPARKKSLVATWSAFTDWWLQNRFSKDHGLCYYLHGNDSGWDNTSLMHQGSPLVAPDLNAFLIRQCRWLTKHASNKVARAKFDSHAKQLLTALLEHLWNGEQFVARLRDTTAVATPSLVTCMPLVLGQDIPEKIRKKVIKQVRRCTTQHGVATEPPDSPFYDAHGYWRGPIWGPSTMLIVEGLRCSGAQTLAKQIAQRYCATCATHGFAENFEATTGLPLEDKAYTWTAAAYLELLPIAQGNR